MACFSGFSFFLIAAAVMLIALLFKLGIEQRARELGILAAAGFGRKRITRLLAREGLIVAAIGAAVACADRSALRVAGDYGTVHLVGGGDRDAVSAAACVA